jgi:hypothetical protein
MFTSGEVISLPSPTPSTDMIYVESDDVNPSHVHYNKENFPIIVDEEDIIKNNPKKSFLRDVRSSKRRQS